MLAAVGPLTRGPSAPCRLQSGSFANARHRLPPASYSAKSKRCPASRFNAMSPANPNYWPYTGRPSTAHAHSTRAPMTRPARMTRRQQHPSRRCTQQGAAGDGSTTGSSAAFASPALAHPAAINLATATADSTQAVAPRVCVCGGGGVEGGTQALGRAGARCPRSLVALFLRLLLL